MRNVGSLNRVITVLCGISLLCVVVDKSLRCRLGGLCIDSFVLGYLMSDEVGREYVWRSIMGVGERGGGYVIKRC